MKKFILNIAIWFQTMLYRLGISMANAEQDLMKPKDLVEDEKKKFNQRAEHKNPIAESLIRGERNSEFVNNFYETLKKADKFMQTATPEKIEMAANKWGTSLGKKDKYGRRYEHFGFFDPKSRHYGKTMKEVMLEENIERSAETEKEHELEFMFSNKPTVSHIYDENQYEVIEEKKLQTDEDIKNEVYSEFKKLDKNSENHTNDVLEKYNEEILQEIKKRKPREIMTKTTRLKKDAIFEKHLKFPMIVTREMEDIDNKLEMLTEYVHIRKINEDKFRIVECFIPSKFKVYEHLEDHIFGEITNIDLLSIKDEYGGKYWYKITKFRNYEKYGEVKVKQKDGTDKMIHTYDLIRFDAEKIQYLH